MPTMRIVAIMLTLAMVAVMTPATRVLAAASITGAQMPNQQCRAEANRKASAAATERVAYYDQCMARKSKGQK